VFRKRTTEADTCSEGQDVLKIARMGKDIPDLMEAVLGRSRSAASDQAHIIREWILAC
jgi:hypothetical protein